jgi:diguanylate cyclase (GGDEF)-like protein
MRLTRRVFVDLAIWMICAGLIIGVVFPPVLVMFGVPADIVLTPFFFSVCLLAGAVVGGINILLARLVVLPRLETLVAGMRKVESVIEEATFTGDWSGCDPEACQVPVDSDDLIGESAAAFNGLIDALKTSHDVEDSVDEFTRTMTSQLELEPLCEAAMRDFLEATNSSAGAILAVVGGELAVLESFGIGDVESLPENDHILQALRSQQPIYIDVPEELPIQASLVEFRPREVAFLPLVVQTTAIGVVVLARSAAFERKSQPLSQIYARTFVKALANAMAHNDLQRIAALDSLTNCYNRRFGSVRLREEFSRAERGNTPLGVMMFDIDHFKQVNDTYGHLVGDRVLAAVASEARTNLRESDILVRYGGEEFLCVLPGATAATAKDVSERIRQSIEKLMVQDRNEVVGCTVSAGYTSYPEVSPENEIELVRIADRALYRAKESGRNRSVEGGD